MRRSKLADPRLPVKQHIARHSSALSRSLDHPVLKSPKHLHSTRPKHSRRSSGGGSLPPILDNRLEALQRYYVEFHKKSRDLLRRLERSVLGRRNLIT